MPKVEYLLFVGLFAAAVLTAAAGEVRVDVYEGPEDCEEAERVAVADRLGIHYTGTIDESSAAGEPGRQFDSSRPRGAALDVTIGVDELIEGWDAGLLGLCRGAKAILVVPPEMAYGEQGVGELIPGDATLRFDVEVVSVTKPPPQPDLFEELDVDRDGFLAPEEIQVHFRKEGPDAEMPPNLLENEDKNGDGLVSREEFGGPSMPWDMCLEMLHRNAETTALGLAVRWLCQRPRDVKIEGREDEGSGSEEL